MIARREDWKALPLPKARAAISIDRRYTNEELSLIREGCIPKQMEDKWFVFFEEPWCFIHRSWTGFCIYQVKFEQAGESFRIVEALANRDSDQHAETDASRDQLMLAIRLDSLAKRDVREAMKLYVSALSKK